MRTNHEEDKIEIFGLNPECIGGFEKISINQKHTAADNNGVTRQCTKIVFTKKGNRESLEIVLAPEGLKISKFKRITSSKTEFGPVIQPIKADKVYYD